jgi:cytochrome c oxidase subunit 3
MNQAAILNAPGGNAEGNQHSAAVSVALWLFMGVATALFLLFLAAYVMRMDASDWSPLAMPWQLWLSTSMLLLAGVLLQLAEVGARALQMQRTRALLIAAGVCGCAFLGVQWWGWQVLLTMHVTAIGNPAGSFFYLLTAMHGMHVAGGLLAWGITASSAWRQDTRRLAWRIGLCARYWHFLLAVWVLLFAALGWLTPEVVRLVCGTR